MMLRLGTPLPRPSSRCCNIAARDLSHGVLPSANNDAPVGVDGDSMQITDASEERARGAVGSDLAQSLIVSSIWRGASSLLTTLGFVYSGRGLWLACQRGMSLSVNRA